MNTITVFHKDYCSYCRNTRKTLESYGLQYQAIEVTNNPVEFSNMVARSGRITVPQIFFGDTHIGGYEDLRQHIKRNKGIRLDKSNLITRINI